MKSNGLFLKDIPEKEKIEEICKLAILNNPLAFEYIPKSNVTRCIAFRKREIVLATVVDICDLISALPFGARPFFWSF